MRNTKACSTAWLKASVCFTALLAAGAAHAQSGEEANDRAAVEGVVVTGSRVVRDGYQAPTPVSVVGRDEIQRSATPNIADYVNTLPAVSGSSTPTTTNTQVGAGRQGINSLNLRGIGDVRTLTLLDGRRVGGMINNGVVDVSQLPQQLIARVDVVTGGASASYGSDALSGVVNFVLDTKFTGLKGEIVGGQTTYNDNRNWKAALSYGASFADGRGHFLLRGRPRTKTVSTIPANVRGPRPVGPSSTTPPTPRPMVSRACCAARAWL